MGATRAPKAPADGAQCISRRDRPESRLGHCSRAQGGLRKVRELGASKRPLAASSGCGLHSGRLPGASLDTLRSSAARGPGPDTRPKPSNKEPPSHPPILGWGKAGSTQNKGPQGTLTSTCHSCPGERGPEARTPHLTGPQFSASLASPSTHHPGSAGEGIRLLPSPWLPRFPLSTQKCPVSPTPPPYPGLKEEDEPSLLMGEPSMAVV